MGYTGIRIRGTDASRINVTLNGLPYNDAESQGTFFVDLPDFLSSVSSIQVQRGVGTSTNGAGAFGASINLATNEFNSEAYGEINNSYGSFNTWKNTVKAGTGLINDHFTVDARLSSIRSDGFIDRAKSNLQGLYLSAAWFAGSSSIRFNYLSGKEKTYQAWNGILQSDLSTSRTSNSNGSEKPGAPYDNQTDNYNQDHYQLFFNHGFNEHLSLNSAVFLTRGKGYYEEYKAAQSFEAYSLPDHIVGSDTVAETDLVRRLWLDNYYYGNVTSLQYKNGGTQLTFGGGGNRYDGKHYGTIIWTEQGAAPKDYRYYLVDAHKKDINVYAKWEQQLATHWNIFADMQWRYVDYKLNGFKDNPALVIEPQYNFFNPKAGLRYTNKEWSAYLSYAVANKEPNRDDFEAGKTQQPKAEHLQDLELGMEKKTSKYTVAANFFHMYYRDQLVLTGKINDVGAYTRTNVPKSYRAGIELQGAYQFNRTIGVSANATFSKNKLVDFVEFVDDYDNGTQKDYSRHKTDLALSPNTIVSGSLNLRPVHALELNFISKYVGRQYLDNSSLDSRSLHDYYTQDVRVGFTVPQRIFKELRLIGQVNNLFNRKYEPSGYTYSYIYNASLTTENYVFPMAGINFMGAVNIKL